jgi:hypothetical protein
MEEGLSIVRFCVINFFGVLLNSRPFQPISTLLIKLVESLVNSEENPDEEMKDRIKWIYEHTHKDVDAHLSVVELLVFRNLAKGVNTELEINNRTFLLHELYNHLDEISKELTNMVITVGKKYNMDFPSLMTSGKTTQTISLD